MKNLSKLIILSLLAVILLVSNQNFVSRVNAQKLDNVSCKSYVVMDSSGRILNEKNANEKYEVASICKLMTTLITLEKIEAGELSLDDKFVASEYACSAEGSQAFLDAGSEYLVEDLLKSVIVASANDSAIVLAENIGGSEDLFVNIMNEKASKLGMNNTLYANSTGLSGKNQYSTAQDTAIILNRVSMYEIYQNDCKIWMDSLIHPSGRETELVNTNRLIKYYPYCQTGKTGFTDEAGYCLSSTSVKDDLKLTCVVLGCPTSADRFADSVALYNETYANYKSQKVLDKNMPIDNTMEIVRGRKSSIEVLPSQDYNITLRRGGDEVVEIKYEFESKLSAPISLGDVVGKALIVLDGEVIEDIDLVANENIERETYRDILDKIANNFALF